MLPWPSCPLLYTIIWKVLWQSSNGTESIWCKNTVRCIISPANRSCSTPLCLGGLCKWRFVGRWTHLWNCNAVAVCTSCLYVMCTVPFQNFQDIRDKSLQRCLICAVSFNTTKSVLWCCLLIRPEASGVLEFDLSNSMSWNVILPGNVIFRRHCVWPAKTSEASSLSKSKDRPFLLQRSWGVLLRYRCSPVSPSTTGLFFFL